MTLDLTKREAISAPPQMTVNKIDAPARGDGNPAREAVGDPDTAPVPIDQIPEPKRTAYSRITAHREGTKQPVVVPWLHERDERQPILRLLFRFDAGLWGALIMFRGPNAPDFSTTEADLLERATSGVAAAIRREMVLTEIAHPHDADGPGLLLLSAALDPLHITPTAQRWLTEIDDGVDPGREIPYGVMTLAARALTGAPPQGSLRSRIRARTGQWLTLHAERLAGDPPQVSIIVEPSRPVEIARLVADAYQLTARERDVVRLLACGYSRHEIARLLTLSPHTVDDHIKRVFGKTPGTQPI